MHRFAAALIALFLLCLAPLATTAQVIPGLSSSSGSETADASDSLAEALKQAAEAGVSVVVVDPGGAVLGQSAPPDPDPAAGGQSDMSGLMTGYHKVETFIDRFDERLTALPTSVNEVLYILRATSPDGRIMTYVWVLIVALVLLALGRVAMVEIFGKRIMRGFVTSRIREAPRGYREKIPFLVLRFLVGMAGTFLVLILVTLVALLVFGNLNDLSIEITIAAIYLSFMTALSSIQQLSSAVA